MAAQKEVEEAIQIVRQSIEKKVLERTEKIIKVEIENVIKQEFIDALTHKVEQIAKVVGKDYSEDFINFGCEIPRINPADTKSVKQLIEGIDEVNLEFFFKKETNLHIFNFCSKYFMFSQFCNTREVNLINFNWSKNKFEPDKICYCFMCKFNLKLAEDQIDKEKAEKENDN